MPFPLVDSRPTVYVLCALYRVVVHQPDCIYETNICNICRVNFRGVITPVLGFFSVFTPFLGVAVCAAVKKVVRNYG